MPRLQLLLAAILFGTTGTAQALLADGRSPLAIGAGRIVVGGIVLAALAAVAGGWRPGGADRSRTWPMGWVLLAGAGVAIYQLAFFSALTMTGVAVGTVVAIGSGPDRRRAHRVAARGTVARRSVGHRDGARDGGRRGAHAGQRRRHDDLGAGAGAGHRGRDRLRHLRGGRAPPDRRRASARGRDGRHVRHRGDPPGAGPCGLGRRPDRHGRPTRSARPLPRAAADRGRLRPLRAGSPARAGRRGDDDRPGRAGHRDGPRRPHPRRARARPWARGGRAGAHGFAGPRDPTRASAAPPRDRGLDP